MSALVRKVELDDTGYPERVTIEMDRAELVYLAKLLGAQCGLSANAVMPNGDYANNALYCALAGDVINRFWDDGVDGATARGEEK